MGRGVTATKLAFLHARDSHVKQLEATQAELINKVQDLQNVVQDLAGKKVTSCFIIQTSAMYKVVTKMFVVVGYSKKTDLILILREAM